ncbi:AMP-binding protein [Bisgaard Taxon 10/6]|uniref:AMP-binding protein n=1 Tax=Exercitatus varius TaxID=67857 RepID=UPI00294B55DC|nr:AMP-binding protein [Exercitatus varius]MDG2961312.1 AMP-binding protein [Exercitatus varius]
MYSINNVIQRSNRHKTASQPEWLWGDFVQRATQIAQQFQQQRIHSVACWLTDGAQFGCVLLACFMTHVRLLLPPNRLAENRDWAMENADLLFDDEVFFYFGIEQKLTENSPHFSVAFAADNSTEIWLKTSGSSGEAKVIVKTACQMWAEAEALSQVFERDVVEQVIGSVSVQHLYGLTFRIMLPLYQGWQIGRRQLNYAEYLLAESRQQRSLWVCSPALLNNIHFGHTGLSEYRIAGLVSSGGVLAESTANQLRRQLPCPVMEIYGSSETGVIARRFDYRQWRIFPHSRIGIDERGALWVESPWSNGCQQTADIVEIDERGFTLLGRADRIIKLNDHRISLNRMEQHLLKHPWVRDCHLGLHPRRSRLVAWVALEKTALSLERKQLIERLKAHLAQTELRIALPRYWRFCENLPRNSQFKLNHLDFEKLCEEIA